MTVVHYSALVVHSLYSADEIAVVDDSVLVFDSLNSDGEMAIQVFVDVVRYNCDALSNESIETAMIQIPFLASVPVPLSLLSPLSPSAFSWS